VSLEEMGVPWGLTATVRKLSYSTALDGQFLVFRPIPSNRKAHREEAGPIGKGAASLFDKS